VVSGAIAIEFAINAGDVREFLEGRGERVIEALRIRMAQEMLNLKAYVDDEKLSGQVLNQRSGNLKNSGFTEVQDDGNQITGFVGYGMTVPYARIHELGGQINVPAVDGKLMVFERAGAMVFATKHRAFTVEMPARPYLQPSLEEKLPDIREGLLEAINTAVHA
jgi:phage gpG-like protein